MTNSALSDAPTFESTEAWDLLSNLDLSEEYKKSDVCESLKGCSNTATWISTMSFTCKHDGLEVALCDRCKAEEDLISASGDTIWGCLYCEEGIMIGLTWRRI